MHFLNSGTQSLDDYYLKKDTVNVLMLKNKSCFYDYSVLNEDKHNYYPYWTSNNSIVDLKSSFEYTNQSTCLFIGKYSTYLANGGYIYKINKLDLNQTLNDLKLLQKLNWINQETRALFIELVVYNPNINLFSLCQFIFEFLPTGKIIPILNMRSINIWSSQRELTISLFYSIYMIIIFILIARQINKYKQVKINYFKNFWNYVNLSLFILSLASLPIYLYKIYSMYDLAKLKNLNNISRLTQWNDILSILLAFCSFLSIIKLIELLKNNSKLKYLTLVVENSLKELISLIVVFVILWLAFVQLMYIVYNEQLYGYSTFIKSMETNFQIILGKFNIKALIQINYTIGAVIFSSYNIIILMILINIIIIVISDNFLKLRLKSKKSTMIINFIKDLLFSKMKKVVKKKLVKISYEDYVYSDETKNLELSALYLITYANQKIKKQRSD